MTWFINTKRTALTVALCAVFTVAGAKSFDQTGPAPESITPLTTYGVDVATRTALKSVVPAGWQLFVHRGATLPTSMSWRTGATWPMALTEFVEGTDVSVLVDWERKAVYFRPVTVAVEDAAKRTMVAQAATTPLPSLAVEGAGLKVATPELAKNATPPAPAVDPAVVSNLEVKLHSLEAQLAAAQERKTTSDGEIATRVAALETALKEKGESLQQAQAELTAARDTARQAEKAAADLKTQQDAARVELEGRIEALASRQAAAVPVATATVVQPVVKTAEAAPAASGPAPVSVAASAPALAAIAPSAILATSATPTASAPEDIEQYEVLSASKSFNRASVRDVAQYVADVHGLHLVLNGPEAFYRGPVTVLAGDAAEDMRLMHKALGDAAGVSFELFRDERVLKVDVSNVGYKSYARVAEGAYSGPMPALTARARPAVPQSATAVAGPKVHAAAPAALPAVAVTPVVVAPVAAASQPLASTAAAQKAVEPMRPVAAAQLQSAAGEVSAPAEPTPALPKLRLEIGVGEDLQTAVTAFLQKQGYETRWQVEELFEASSAFSGQGDSVVDVLSLLLPKLGLSADVQSDVKRVTVRVADPVRDAK